MSVVALKRSAPQPRTIAVTLWLVLPYWPTPDGLTPGEAVTRYSQEAAVREGKATARRAPGALVYKVRGDPLADLWGEPVVVARFGETPREPPPGRG